jgi:hypothetical protein
VCRPRFCHGCAGRPREGPTQKDTIPDAGWEQRVNVSQGKLSMDRRSIRLEGGRCRGLQGEPEQAYIFTLKASTGPEKGLLLTDRDHVDDRESLWSRDRWGGCRNDPVSGREFYSRRLATHNACFARTGLGVEVEVGSRWVGRT